MSSRPIRVRFAPSPTGLLHVGGLRTALYNFLFARKAGGTFILRIEDTDQKRFVAEAEQDILDSLAWAGINFDEGPVIGGPVAPYHQSRRRESYARHAADLVTRGAAYYAFDTEDEIEALRTRYKAKGIESVGYGAETRGEMRNSLTLASAEVESLLAAGVPSVIRLLVNPGEEIVFEDLVRGSVSFSSDQVDDQVLVKSDGLPTYHLANVVDDHEMEISHVIRGEEWLPSTPKHMLLYKALGWTPPAMAHLPLILSPTGGKLSKRNADKLGIPVSVRDYISEGYLPAALINFLALLGWHPSDDQEIFSLAELADAFELDRVGSAGTQFDLDKLKWFNGQYIRSMTINDLASVEIGGGGVARIGGKRVADESWNGALVWDLVKDRIALLTDLVEFDYLDPDRDPTDFDSKVVKKRWNAEADRRITSLSDAFSRLTDAEWNAATLHDIVERFMLDGGSGIGKVLPALRLAVSGKASGPDLFPMLEVLGRAAVGRRLDSAGPLIREMQTAGSDSQ